MPFQFRKEAIEEDLNTNFPSQGQGNPPLYYSLSEVVVPTYSINQAAEGTSLPTELQQAWDFSTGLVEVDSGSVDIITNPGFWLVRAFAAIDANASGDATLNINDGVTDKRIWRNYISLGTTDVGELNSWQNVVFLRSGDKLFGNVQAGGTRLSVAYRQIASLNGTLVNPLGYSAA